MSRLRSSMFLATHGERVRYRIVGSLAAVVGLAQAAVGSFAAYATRSAVLGSPWTGLATFVLGLMAWKMADGSRDLSYTAFCLASAITQSVVTVWSAVLVSTNFYAMRDVSCFPREPGDSYSCSGDSYSCICFDDDNEYCTNTRRDFCVDSHSLDVANICVVVFTNVCVLVLFPLVAVDVASIKRASHQRRMSAFGNSAFGTDVLGTGRTGRTGTSVRVVDGNTMDDLDEFDGHLDDEFLEEVPATRSLPNARGAKPLDYRRLTDIPLP